MPFLSSRGRSGCEATVATPAGMVCGTINPTQVRIAELYLKTGRWRLIQGPRRSVAFIVAGARGSKSDRMNGSRRPEKRNPIV